MINYNFTNRPTTGDLIKRIPNEDHMKRCVAARAFMRDNDPDNVRAEEVRD